WAALGSTAAPGLSGYGSGQDCFSPITSARHLKMQSEGEMVVGLSRSQSPAAAVAGPGEEGAEHGPADSLLLAEAETVAVGWMLDFSCRCLCRHFCEGRRRDFERTRNQVSFQIIETHQMKTVYLCQFLMRIAEGKTLDSRFESDQKISPLESALSVWSLLEQEQSEPDKLHEDICRLICIQAVAVHMEKGYFKEAAEVIERLFPEMKLAMITKQKDPYHPFFQSFSYNLMVDKIKNYINIFLNEKTNCRLLKAATEEAKIKRLGTTTSQDKQRIVTETINKNLEIKQRFVTRMSNKTMLQCYLKCCNRWTWEEDQKLKEGVKKFGVGKWTKILLHYNFNNRTDVMLKDRWRTMAKLNII
uniref:Telomeric repeat-binding factor n=1 Tax=Sphenodon punctatus TaxID=8508 RepID=A0A8D0HQK9_SPHPU